MPIAARTLTCRVHDECNGSDVFGSDICTCRPYLIHGIEECAQDAQAGGAGLIVYNRKEGRALGEVTKFLVYNARKRQEGGDQAATYFERTECVAGVQDARFQQLMPDVMHWLGITPHRPLRFDVEHEIRRARRDRHRDRRARADPAPTRSRPMPRSRSEAKKAAGYFRPIRAEPQTICKASVGRELDKYLAMRAWRIRWIRTEAALVAASRPRPCASARTRCWSSGLTTRLPDFASISAGSTRPPIWSPR